ncbi:hypothetical protein ACFT0G_15630 [Streptomyces sp. NPDC057020]|uniref:hypothetical protein n=1 Tax=unclassified Streptomyces TaxID=2593676 RepID=UPI0036390D40
MTTILAALNDDLHQAMGHALPDVVLGLQLCAALVSLSVNVDRAVRSWNSRKRHQK